MANELRDAQQRLWEAVVAAVQAHGLAVVDTGAFLVALAGLAPEVREVFVRLGLTDGALVQALGRSAVRESEAVDGVSRQAWQVRIDVSDVLAPPSAGLRILLALVRPRLRCGDRTVRAADVLHHAGVEIVQLRRTIFEVGGGLALAEHEVPWARWAELHQRAREGDRTAVGELATDPRLGMATMCRAYLAGGEPTWAWLRDALTDMRKWIVPELPRTTGVLPPALHLAMIDAGVLEPNPSFNRQFLEVALRACEPEIIVARMIAHIESGDPVVANGVANALYWTRVLAGVDLPVVELVRRFLATRDRGLRRSLIANLTSMDVADLDAAGRAALAEAVAAARVDSDDYVRHRAALFAGDERQIRPLPPRPDE
ncbi:hypothetical protein [Nannocystis radixulma]|uniref:DUF2336 domain-containing protein n=1 Tax=Nannocystis radixulma TaxID=2995305 RepID=A0ABT5BNL7_9BACT|nr:hypothetical protein [Nannocystis radixulma]MDC0675766.1 hypothetical protein [Nannocystis radixulma]